jgi:hypothetical protein
MLQTVSRFFLAALLLATACARSPSSPSPDPAAPAAPAAGTTAFAGRLVATVTAQPLAGIGLDLGGLATVTSNDGTFRFEWPSGTRHAISRLTMEGPGILSRSLFVTTSDTRDVTLDAIALDGGFDLDYYRRLVRRGLDQPDNPLPLRRWTQAPRVYLRTVDEAGVPIDALTLDTVAEALLSEPEAWTGGRFGIEELARGVDTREGVKGWVTVKWPSPAVDGICAQAQVAVDGGWIELNYLSARCGCNGSRMAPGLVRHELGHTMGFFHTNDAGDLLTARVGFTAACSGTPSPRERLHAAIAYSRSVGNTDPDADPGSVLHGRLPDPVIVVD